MSISLTRNLSKKYNLLVDLKGPGYCKLYSKNENRYICSFIVPWFDPDEILYIKIKVSKIELEEREKKLLCFSKEELSKFSVLLTNLCFSINEELDKDDTHLCKMQIEYIAMTFWANSAMIYVCKNKWDKLSELLYALAQIIYTGFGVYQQKHFNIPMIAIDF